MRKKFINSLEEVNVPDTMKNFIEMQYLMSNLNESNLNKTVDSFSNLIGDNECYYDEICRLITVFTTHRSKEVQLFAKFAVNLMKKLEPSFIKALLLQSERLFLRYLYIYNAFSNQDLVNIKFKQSFEHKFMFVPEFGYPKLVDDQKNTKYALNRKEKKLYLSDKCKLYRELLEFGYLKDSVQYLIKYDMLDDLKEKINKIRFDTEQLLAMSYYESVSPLVKPLYLAAFYASTKCFFF